jgi:hypothetical protein
MGVVSIDMLDGSAILKRGDLVQSCSFLGSKTWTKTDYG